ncbi:MAG: ACT domain-containing protein, partial [Anaerolineae bacterium]
LEQFRDEKLPHLQKYETCLIVNFFGETVREYTEMAEQLSPLDRIDALEMNISCPNVEEGGLAFSSNPQIVEQVVDALRGKDFRNALNMPFQASVGFDTIRPYMQLGAKLGLLHAQVAAKPITQLEIEVNGDDLEEMVTAIAAGALQGLLMPTHPHANPINAPVIANEMGISVTQTIGQNPLDYPNLISCRARWDGGERLLAGVLFAGGEPRIVRWNKYTLDARPEGSVLLLQNQDVPGVIGQIGTILAAYDVNIGEWRMGRDKPGGEALSVINLDSAPPQEALDALKRISAITELMLVQL